MLLSLARLLLRAYPELFRARYGDEVLRAYSALVRAAGARGAGAALVASVGGLYDLARGAIRERRRATGTAIGRRCGTRGGGEMFDKLIRDTRLALRGLARRPLFASVAAGSLAIGIAAVTTVFSVANTLLLQPLPGIPNYDRVVELGRSNQGRGFDTFTYPDFEDIRSEVAALDEAAAYSAQIVSVSTGDEGIRGMAFFVSPSYFDILGATPSIGRYLGPSEDTGVGEHPVVVVGHRFWQDRLGGAPDVLGSTVLVNRVPLTVVGITAEDFAGHMVGIVPDLYVPLMQLPAMPDGEDSLDNRGSSSLLALGRLAPDATLRTLNVQLAGLAARLAEAYPETNSRRGFSAVSLGPIPGAGRGGVQLFLSALLGMVGLILLVTCSNVAGMFLARATGRQREVAVRRSLGANRGDIVGQLTVETLLVFVLGGGAGIALGLWSVGLIRPDLLPTPIPIALDFRPDFVVLSVAAVVTLATGLVFGLLPAAHASRVDLVSAMRDDARAGSRRIGRLRLLFAGGQVGLSLVLLTTAALFVRSLQRAATVDAGFDPKHAFVTYLNLSMEGYDDVEGPLFQAELIERLRSEGWVEAASVSSDLPQDLASRGTAVRPEGWEAATDAPLLGVDFNEVSEGYFETLGISLLAGRALTPDDRADGPPVAVVSERFAEEAWPGEDPLGRTFHLGRSTDGPAIEVVGVVDDVKNQIVTEAPKPFVYFPITQRYNADIQLAVRTSADRDLALAGIRAALVAADPQMSRGPIVPLEEYTSLGLLPQRIAAGLTTGLALLALLLSAIGIYGVISFAVGAQRREIGIRLALGADGPAVVRGLVRRGLVMVGPGVVIGGALSIGVGHVVRGLLLDLSPYDPIALGAVGALLMTVVLLASWIPARGAAGVDPAESLREE